MAGQIRNTRVAAGTLTAIGYQVVYTVPAGNAFILKAVHLNHDAGTSITVLLSLNLPGTLTLDLQQAALGAAAPTDMWTWSGWTVLNAGDRIMLNPSAAGNLYYWIAGAVLPFA